VPFAVPAREVAGELVGLLQELIPPDPQELEALASAAP